MEHQQTIHYIRRILDGETELFSRFVQLYSRRIYGLIIQIVPNKEDTEELVQDTFVKAYTKLNTFKGDCSFSTWLYRIAYNTAISATRKRKSIFFMFDEKELENISEQTIDTILDDDSNEENLQRLEHALEKLNVEDKLLITLFYTENKSTNEIALITELTPENVKVKLFRIRKKIISLMEIISNKRLSG